MNVVSFVFFHEEQVPLDHLPQRLHEQCTRIGEALSSRNRLQQNNLFWQGEHSVEAIAEKTGMSHANTGAHVHERAEKLRDAGLDTRHAMNGMAERRADGIPLERT